MPRSDGSKSAEKNSSDSANSSSLSLNGDKKLPTVAPSHSTFGSKKNDLEEIKWIDDRESNKQSSTPVSCKKIERWVDAAVLTPTERKTDKTFRINREEKKREEEVATSAEPPPEKCWLDEEVLPSPKQTNEAKVVNESKITNKEVPAPKQVGKWAKKVTEEAKPISNGCCLIS